MDRRRILLVIFDGLGDRPVTELGHQTPLEAAPKPNLDWFASNGMNGLLDPIGPGIRPGSDTSHLALFGYNPIEVYTGRGPFEAAGVGLELQKGDVAFRCNFATVGDDLVLKDRRAGRIKDGTADLAASLNGMKLGRHRVLFKEGTEHRAVLVLRGKGLSSRVTDTDPHEEGQKILESKPVNGKGKTTAKLLNAFTRKAYTILKDHPVNAERVKNGLPPANMVVCRGGGVAPDLQPMKEKYGLKAAGIAGVALIKGMFRSTGMDVLEVKGATGGLDTDMVAKAEAALLALTTYDLVVVNVKAPDLCGHDGMASEKIRVVERMDQMMGHLRAHLPQDVIVAITSDHSTPCAIKDHSGDPVPLTVFGEGIRVDEVPHFDERSVAKGSLGRVLGRDLMAILMNQANRTEKFGA